MYDAIDVAGFVVDTALKQGQEITNLKLQKILYYLELDKLYSTGEPLFFDAIEAWKLGPVYPSVYHEYKVFGSNQIEYIPEIFKFSNSDELKFQKYDFDIGLIKKEERDDFKKKISKLLMFNPFELVKFTHNHTPWEELKDRIFNDERQLAYDKKELAQLVKKNKKWLDEVYA